jgi:tetratricopeptide (TPR) repeat protein
LGIQAYLYFQQIEKLIWTGSLSTQEIVNHKQFMVNRLSPYVSAAMGIAPASLHPLPSFESIAAQEKYLKAKALLSTDLTELSYKTAKEYLRAAIDLSPDFARAYASLCENTVTNSWRGDEKANLEEAQVACDKALNLTPDDPYVNSAMAYLKRRTGRVRESIAQYKNILAHRAGYVKAISGISSAYLDAFRQNLKAFPGAIQQAIRFGEQASLLQPDKWMHHMQLGMMYYFANDIPQAIKSYQRSAALHPTAGAYASIGTMYLCRGKIDKSIIAFTRSQQLDPSSYVGDEFLGTGHYYLEHFKKSAILRQRALDSIEASGSGSGAIHQMWGQLGDSYRQTGEVEKATEAYLKAITLVDKDIIRNNDAVEDHVYRYYYYLYLSQLMPERYSENALDDKELLLEQSLDEKMSSGAFLKLAIIWAVHNNHKKSKQALDKATSACPGYAKYPDIKDLIM